MKKFIRFAVVGFLNTAIDYGLFAALFYSLRINLVMSNVLAYLFALTNSYFLNRAWTYQIKGGTRGGRAFIMYACGNLMGVLISTVIVTLMSGLMNPIFAKLISITIVFPWNYVYSKFFVYRTSRSDSM